MIVFLVVTRAVPVESQVVGELVEVVIGVVDVDEVEDCCVVIAGGGRGAALTGSEAEFSSGSAFWGDSLVVG